MERKASLTHLEKGDAAPHFEDIHEEQLLDTSARRKLRAKLDLRIVPICWILYFVNLLDRAAVGASVAYGFRSVISTVFLTTLNSQ